MRNEKRHVRTKQNVATYSRWFLARGFFYLEDGGDTFLRNIGSIYKIYAGPHARRRHFSRCNMFYMRQELKFCVLFRQSSGFKGLIFYIRQISGKTRKKEPPWEGQMKM
jgi:hypothetical protein